MNKDKPENLFNVTKNQEFKLFTSHHFKNLISPKPMEESVESNSAENLKLSIVTTARTLPLFQILLKKDFPENLVILGMGI